MKTYEIVKAFALGEYSEAVKLLTRAANDGDPEAMLCLAICHSRGIGVKQDIGAAFQWYRTAAENGGPEAQKAYEDFDRQIRLADDSAILDGTDMQYRAPHPFVRTGQGGAVAVDDDLYFPRPVTREFNDEGIIESGESISCADEKTYSLHTYKEYDYTSPPIDLLKVYPKDETSREGLEESAATLEEVLNRFLKTTAKVINIVPGPTVTRYEVEVPSGFSVKTIEPRVQDLEYELATVSKIRIEAPIPGKRAIGIEIPNTARSIVGLSEILSSDEFLTAKSAISFPVGKDTEKEVVLCDLKKVPHLLIAGQTGSGKSGFLHSMLVGLMYKSSPADVRFILIDPKRVELGAFAHMPHLLFDKILYEPSETLAALKWVCMEMEKRYSIFSEIGCAKLDSYNAHEDVISGKYPKQPEIVVVIDEIADLMQSNLKSQIEERIKTIAAKARAAGIHLIVATQRPSRDVITGTIKANLSSRIAFRVSSRVDSNIILDTSGAEALSGYGDMLFYPVDYQAPKRVQSPYVSDVEIVAVTEYIKANYAPDFNTEAEKYVGGGDIPEAVTYYAEQDPLFYEVLKAAVKSGAVSVSGIQRRFSIGYARSARMVDAFESLGYIGPSTNNGKGREVLITPAQLAEISGETVEEEKASQETIVEPSESVSAHTTEPSEDAPPAAVFTAMGDDYDELIPDVLEMIIKAGKVTVSSVQRKFTIGYGRASRIIDAIERLGYIGPATTIPRAIYITREKYKELFGKDISD